MIVCRYCLYGNPKGQCKKPKHHVCLHRSDGKYMPYKPGGIREVSMGKVNNLPITI